MKLLIYSPNFNDTTVEIWEWLSNFIPHLTGHVITYPCWNSSKFICVKGAQAKTEFIMVWKQLRTESVKTTFSNSKNPLCTCLRLILCMHPADDTWHYNVKLSLIGWAHIQNGSKNLPLVHSCIHRWHHRSFHHSKMETLPLNHCTWKSEMCSKRFQT